MYWILKYFCIINCFKCLKLAVDDRTGSGLLKADLDSWPYKNYKTYGHHGCTAVRCTVQSTLAETF